MGSTCGNGTLTRALPATVASCDVSAAGGKSAKLWAPPGALWRCVCNLSFTEYEVIAYSALGLDVWRSNADTAHDELPDAARALRKDDST
ncbi:hypothetical protein EON66_09890, partial [archaeon]